MLGKLSRHTRKRLLREGSRATAVVLDIAERGIAVTHGATGIVGNTELALNTHLRVEPVNEAAFEVHERFRYGQLSVPPNGSRVNVIYDPNDHDVIMMDDSAPDPLMSSMGFTTGTDPTALLATIKEAQAAAGGDREALAHVLREKFAGGASVISGDQVAQAVPTSDPDPDPVELLEKLVKLRDAGVLTQAEFQQQKARILGESQ